MEGAVLVWLLLIPGSPFLLLGPGAAFLAHSPVRLATICFAAYWAVIAFNAVQLAWHGYNLLTGNWRSPSVVERLVIKALGIVPIGVLLAAPGHIYFSANPAEPGRLPVGFDVAGTNHGIFTGLTVLAVIVCIQFVWDVWKAAHGGRAPQILPVL